MYLLIIFLPLLGATISGFFGRSIGEEGAVRVTTSLVMLTFLLSTIAFYEVGLCGNPTYFTLCSWMDSELFQVNWGFLFDSLTVVMLVVVTSVSSLVHMYSTEYMAGDPHRPRFMSYLSLFTFFMLILVTADNFIQMFVGWEGVGLCSYLLINFWYTRIQANKAAIKAMIVNRVGDFGLALGIMAIYVQFKAVDYSTVFATVPTAIGKEFIFMNFSVDSLTLIGLLLFVGSVGKSAQLGLHTWLPDAMEGPTPVSALIHAATMVTAGVFLLARCSPLFEYAPTALSVVTVVGAMTAFFAATTGLLQNDLKRVIAYSTCSQLGYMVFACGLSSYNVGVFHLANHAFFKALLFLSAGSVIHAMADEQDMRRMGGLVRLLPFTYAMMFIGSLSLMGFPFLTGFYSKDVILELAYAKYTVPAHFAHWLGTMAAFFTAFYSMRLLHLTFLSTPQGYKKVMEGVHDAPILMALPLFLLSIGSIFVGYVSRDMIIGVGTDFWSNALFTHPNNLTLLEAEFIPHSIKLVPVIFSLTGAITAFYMYTWSIDTLYNLKISNTGRVLYTFLNRKWFFDKTYTEFITQSALHHGYHTTYKMVDRGVIELLGPHGISQVLYQKSKNLSKFQSGHLYHYTLVMLIGISLPLALIAFNKVSVSIGDPRLYVLFLVSGILWQTRK
jgi:NADH-ubiquinone oxidoreductase chain 5